MPELEPRQLGVQPAFGLELRVRADVDDAAAVHHHDAIGLEHGG
jgi:hypothetical protein